MFTMVPLAQRMGGPHPLDELIEVQVKAVADIILRGMMVEPPPLPSARGKARRRAAR